jgi:hypothetical protein
METNIDVNAVEYWVEELRKCSEMKLLSYFERYEKRNSKTCPNFIAGYETWLQKG